MNLGKERRIRHIFKGKKKNTILVPMDHGITCGPMNGIHDIKKTIQTLANTKVDGVILHKGIIATCEQEFRSTEMALIMHLSASTSLAPTGGCKTIIGSVEEALAFGCDGVSVHVNIGDEQEWRMLSEVGKVASDCYKYGMPLLAMVYARGPLTKDERSLEMVEHAARVGAELGADIVKVNYTGNVEEFKQVVNGCPVPVIIAGGQKSFSEQMFLKDIEDAMTTGIRGVSIGRNVFQSENMPELIEKIYQVVHS